MSRIASIDRRLAKVGSRAVSVAQVYRACAVARETRLREAEKYRGWTSRAM